MCRPRPDTGLSPNVTPFWMVAGAGAEVEVDTETGHVQDHQAGQRRRLRQADQSADRRDADFRRGADAARLHHVREDASRRRPGDQRLARRLQDPRLLDVPPVMENEVVDAYQPNGPFGAKGVGEVATFCVSPAIANAIDDAVGVRLMELPLNPERCSARCARRPASRWRTRDMSTHHQLHAQRRRRSPPTSSRITTWSSCCRTNSA